MFCHTSRVLLQLTTDEVINQRLLHLIFSGDGAQYKRVFASYGIQYTYQDHQYGKDVQLDGKILYERKGLKFRSGDQHFGVNLPVGGYHKIHPFSQNIILGDGHFGHLYICYRPAADGKPAGVLFGLEQSAPCDRVQGGIQEMLRFGVVFPIS